MKLCRRINVIALQGCLLLACGSVSANSVSTAVQCERLLTAAMTGPAGNPTDTLLSDGARTLLSLIDVGLVHIRSEEHALVEALVRLVESTTPLNPFLNLQSPMGRALAAKSEPLVEVLLKEWPAIQEHIRNRLSHLQREFQDREFDQEATRGVMSQQEVPFSRLEPSPSLRRRLQEEFRYLGQTAQHHVLAVGPQLQVRSNEPDSIERWAVYLISKSDGAVVKVPRSYLSARNQHLMLWVRDGVVVGIRQNSSFFRLNAKAKLDGTIRTRAKLQPSLDAAFQVSREVADTVLARNGQIVRVDRPMPVRASAQPSVQGQSDDWQMTVSKFDWQAMKFRKSSAMIMGPKSHLNIMGWPEPSGPIIDSDHFSTEWIYAGPDAKTDGDKIVRRSQDQMEWMAWSVFEGLRSEVIMANTVTISEIDPHEGSAGDRKVAQTRAVKASFPVEKWWEYHVFQKTLSNSPLGLLYAQGIAKGTAIKRTGGPRAFHLLAGIWLFDRGTFELTPVEIEDGPPDIKGEGWWHTVENSNGDLLFEYKSLNHQKVGLWVLDTHTKRLRKIFEETAQEPYASQVTMPLVDYDQMALVGWVLQDRLLVPVATRLSRDGGIR